MEGILLASSSAWILDVVFFALILLGILFGVWRGFVKQVCKIAGWIFSLVVAFIFCVSFKNQLNAWFGMEAAISAGVKNATIGGWISIAISFVSLAILVRLLAWLFGILGTKLVEMSKVLTAINKVLGGILGAFTAMMTIFFLLAICRWIPSGGLHDFISSSTVVGKIFNWQWFWDTATRLPGMLY